jgi:hypothetical protein
MSISSRAILTLLLSFNPYLARSLPLSLLSARPRPPPLPRSFAINGSDADWDSALSRGSVPSTISIKSAHKSGNAEYQKKPKREADIALLKDQLADKKEAADREAARHTKQAKHHAGDSAGAASSSSSHGSHGSHKKEKKHRSHDE